MRRWYIAKDIDEEKVKEESDNKEADEEMKQHTDEGRGSASSSGPHEKQQGEVPGEEPGTKRQKTKEDSGPEK